MKDRYVVDTNVLIAATAAHHTTMRVVDATPVDVELRNVIKDWLEEFESSDVRMLVDSDLKIFDEYNGALNHNDYGRQVVLSKFSTAAVDFLEIAYDENGDGVLPQALSDVVHDRADRKMVATALEAHTHFGEGCIAFASDTDWHEWEAKLLEHSVLLEPIIEEWSRQKHAEKQAR